MVAQDLLRAWFCEKFSHDWIKESAAGVYESNLKTLPIDMCRRCGKLRRTAMRESLK